ncbi:MAG TPA: carboxypeptidase-like regulatory domain-containing protein, partial [Sphingobacteriaceae bacterium]
MKHLVLLFAGIIVVLFPWAAFAQITVSGIVTDANTREALPGVSVRVKGSQSGTATNQAGRFTLSGVPAGSTIVFTSVGFVTKELPAAETLNVSLEEDFAKLEEVVVTGLATSVKRSNLANAVGTISARELTGTAVPHTIESAMNGKLTGANIVQSSGAPGGGISVRLRGLTSVNSSTQPLYVIDGVFVDNSSISSGINSVTIASRGSGSTSNQDNPSSRIADINPEDIESIEILKGASAAAIYGALAASGVVIITTKRGAEGKTRISLNQDVGYSEAAKLLGVDDWSEEKIQGFFQTLDAAGNVTNQPAVDAQKELYRQALAEGRIFDYEKELYGQKGFLTTTSVSVSGGSEKTKFYVSGLYQDEEGI